MSYHSTIQLPELPDGVYPLFYEEEKEMIYIFAIDKEKNYTIRWDGFSKFPNEIYWYNKDENDEYELHREKL